jgi:hypothetical protein
VFFKDSYEYEIKPKKYGYGFTGTRAEIMEVTDKNNSAICTLQVFHFKSY